jgi:hypothetical protein
MITKPFCIFVEPGDIEDGVRQWFAKITGYDMDFIVYGNDPLDAITEALDILMSENDTGLS